MPSNLESLFEYLDNLPGPASLTELTSFLARLGLNGDDLAAHIRFTDSTYQRNLVRTGRWFHVWVLCWKNGQRSPIHDHWGSNCVVQVLRGTLTQTVCAFAPNGHVKAVSSQDFPAGSFIQSHDADLHQVSNLQTGDADLVTLHVYTPPLLRMGTYSLTDRQRGEEVWIEERKFVTNFPENSETPLENVSSWVTPNRLFFVRNHFEAPSLERGRWRLRVEGCVRQPWEWSWEELAALPHRSVFATVECAGNGRSFLQQKQPGVQWGAGAIGHAEWTGVPLRVVLEKAGVEAGAVEVVFEGADRGSEADHPAPMNFARGLPLAKALDPDTLLAYRMNGELLTPSHGFPVRLFVPGWYGVSSVKWLQRIELVSKPFKGYYQTTKYTIQRRAGSGVETEIVGPMAVKSEIIRPQPGAVLGLGANRLFGVAWAGEEAVGGVEVSTDGGASWNAAQLIGLRSAYCWTLWEYLWEVAQPGTYALAVRATSAGGHTQPVEHDLLHGGYIIHHTRPIPIQVEAGPRAPAQAAQLGDWDMLVYDMNSYAEDNSRLALDVEMEFTGGEGI